MKTKLFLGALALALAIFITLADSALRSRANAVRESRRVAIVEARQRIQPMPTADDLKVYYRIETLSDGAKVGFGGSLQYLLDDYGHVLTGGYHSIVPKDDGYVATLGATTYRLNSLGRVVSETNAVGETVTHNP